MAKNFLVVNSVSVEQLPNGDLTNLYHPDILAQVVSTPDNSVEVGWIWDGSSFSPPPVADLAELAAAKLAEINAAFEVACSVLRDAWPPSERETWERQLAEATAYQAAVAAGATLPDTPVLSGIVAQRGVSIEYLVGRVLANAANWSAFRGSLIGQRQALEDDVEAAVALAATDEAQARADIDDIAVGYVIPGL